MEKSEGSPTQLLRDIHNEMKEKELPLPEMVNFGNQKISFIPNDDFFLDPDDKIYRAKLISDIQDMLIQRQDKVILLFGEEGCGKTTICHFLASEKMRIVYFEIPIKVDLKFDPEDFLEENINDKYGCSLDAFDRECPSYLVIIDQLERLNAKQLNLLVKRLHQSLNLRFLCTSRQPLESRMSEYDGHALLQLPIPVLSPEEGKSLIQQIHPSYSEREVELSYLISRGSPSKIKKNDYINRNVSTVDAEETKKVIAAVYSCGVYYDKCLFMRVFHLEQKIVDFFEQAGLIVSIEDSFVPHPFLNECAEAEGLTTDSQAIFTYWYQQAASLPAHLEIAKSFILAIKCFGYQKEAEKCLYQAFNSLSVNKENLSYFIDGAEIDLSLPYRSSLTVYLANALKKLGENGLANQLLKKKRNHKKLGSLIALSLVLMISLTIAFWPEQSSSRPTYVHVKHTHPDFVGRENHLDQLEDRLIKQRGKRVAPVPVAVLWGEGGIGKSEIAIAFANRYLNHFDLVYWIDSATEESYLSSYQHLAAQLNLPFDQKESIDQLVRKVHGHLENACQFPWLLIYDNAEKEFELPQRGLGAIIVTTRDQTNWHLYPCYQITPFCESEALSLFKKVTHKENTAVRLALIKTLENYPLSLNLAAHYIAESPWMSEDLYLEMLSKNKAEFLDRMPTDCRYPYGLVDSWKMTADRLYVEHPEALDWLHVCSYLYPDQISFSLIEEWLAHFSNEQLNFSALKLKVNDILQVLANQALVRCDEDKNTLSIHRLKQEIFRLDEHFDPGKQDKVLDFLVHSLEEFERIDAMESHIQLWPRLQHWELHASWFLDKHRESCSREKIALLNNLLGSWKEVKGEYALAEFYFDQALTIRLELFGKEDLRTILAMDNKAYILYELGRLEESKAMCQEALTSLENATDGKHSYLVILMHNLAQVFCRLHEYDKMNQMNRRILEMEKMTLSDDDVYTPGSKNNLGHAYLQVKDYDQALHCFDQALHDYRTIFGEDHPYVAMTMRNLGRTFLGKGDYRQAEKILNQALAMLTKHHGQEHPRTMLCLQSMGQAQEKMGKKQEAFYAFEKAFTELSQVYDQDHDSMISLSEDLKQLSNSCNDAVMAEKIEHMLQHR
ncbi:MAG: FxSxx-COOH system tetratricopeptide repeat protein [Waddliaceae bacterium]